MVERISSGVTAIGGKVGGATALASRGGAERSASAIPAIPKSISQRSSTERIGTTTSNGIQRFSIMSQKDGVRPIEKMSVMPLAKADVSRPASFSQLPKFNSSEHGDQPPEFSAPKGVFNGNNAKVNSPDMLMRLAVPQQDRQTSMTVDRLRTLVRQPDAEVSNLQRLAQSTHLAQPKIVEKGDVNLGKRADQIQRLWTDAPRRNARIDVMPITPLVEPLTQSEISHLPIVEDRPSIAVPLPAEKAQALADVRERLKVVQTASVEKLKSVAPTVTPDVRNNAVIESAVSTQTATPISRIKETPEIIAKNTLRTEEKKNEKTFSRLLREKETAKAFLQKSAEQAKTVTVAGDALPQGQETVAAKKNDRLQYVVGRTVNDDDVLLAAKDEEAKKMRAKLERMKNQFGIRWPWSKSPMLQQTETVVEQPAKSETPQIQAQKVAQTVSIVTSQPEDSRMVTATTEERTQVATLTLNKVNIAVKDEVKHIVQQKTEATQAKEETDKKEEFAVDQETQKNRLAAAQAGIWLSFGGTDQERVDGEKIAAALPKPSAPTTSGVLLELGFGDAVEAQEIFDPTDLAWREEVASYREMTPSEAKSFVIFTLDSHRAIIRGKGKKASEYEVERVLGKSKVSSHFSRMN